MYSTLLPCDFHTARTRVIATIESHFICCLLNLLKWREVRKEIPEAKEALVSKCPERVESGGQLEALYVLYWESHPESESSKFHLGPSVFKRWTSNFSKAKELGISIAKLVEILLDGLDKASRPSITNPCPNQPSTSTGM